MAPSYQYPHMRGLWYEGAHVLRNSQPRGNFPPQSQTSLRLNNTEIQQNTKSSSTQKQAHPIKHNELGLSRQPLPINLSYSVQGRPHTQCVWARLIALWQCACQGVCR